MLSDREVKAALPTAVGPTHAGWYDEACERTPEEHVPPEEGEDHEVFLGSEAYAVAGAMAETLAEYLRAEEDACRIDHNGFCQAHTSRSPCIVAEARAVLERWEEVTNE